MTVNAWPSSVIGLAEHCRIAAVLALPEAVAQDGDRAVLAASAPIVVGGERAADDAA